MTAASIRRATDADVPTLVELRAVWTGQSADPEYVAAFEQWWRRERDQRITRDSGFDHNLMLRGDG